MVEVCWLLNKEKCRDHGAGRVCMTEKACWYKSQEARKLLKKLHGLTE